MNDGSIEEMHPNDHHSDDGMEEIFHEPSGATGNAIMDNPAQRDVHGEDGEVNPEAADSSVPPNKKVFTEAQIAPWNPFRSDSLSSEQDSPKADRRRSSNLDEEEGGKEEAAEETEKVDKTPIRKTELKTENKREPTWKDADDDGEVRDPDKPENERESLLEKKKGRKKTERRSERERLIASQGQYKPAPSPMEAFGEGDTWKWYQLSKSELKALDDEPIPCVRYIEFQKQNPEQFITLKLTALEAEDADFEEEGKVEETVAEIPTYKAQQEEDLTEAIFAYHGKYKFYIKISDLRARLEGQGRRKLYQEDAYRRFMSEDRTPFYVYDLQGEPITLQDADPKNRNLDQLDVYFHSQYEQYRALASGKTLFKAVPSGEAWSVYSRFWDEKIEGEPLQFYVALSPLYTLEATTSHEKRREMIHWQHQALCVASQKSNLKPLIHIVDRVNYGVPANVLVTQEAPPTHIMSEMKRQPGQQPEMTQTIMPLMVHLQLVGVHPMKLFSLWATQNDIDRMSPPPPPPGTKKTKFVKPRKQAAWPYPTEPQAIRAQKLLHPAAPLKPKPVRAQNPLNPDAPAEEADKVPGLDPNLPKRIQNTFMTSDDAAQAAIQGRQTGQKAVMNDKSATELADLFWKKVGQKSLTRTVEWLHRSAFSFGGVAPNKDAATVHTAGFKNDLKENLFTPTSKDPLQPNDIKSVIRNHPSNPQLAQCKANLVFGTCETNTLMIRTEQCLRRMVELLSNSDTGSVNRAKGIRCSLVTSTSYPEYLPDVNANQAAPAPMTSQTLKNNTPPHRPEVYSLAEVDPSDTITKLMPTGPKKRGWMQDPANQTKYFWFAPILNYHVIFPFGPFERPEFHMIKFNTFERLLPLKLEGLLDEVLEDVLERKLGYTEAMRPKHSIPFDQKDVDGLVPAPVSQVATNDAGPGGAGRGTMHVEPE